MGNEITKVPASAPELSKRPARPLPGEDHVSAGDLTKSFVSLEAVESLVLDESWEMIALTLATLASGISLATMLLITLFASTPLPPLLIAVPWWVWLTPSAASGALWLRVRRRRRNAFKKERDEWVDQLRTGAKNAVIAALARQDELNKTRLLQEWSPALVASSVVVRMGQSRIGLDNAISTIECDVEITSLSPRRCSVTVQGGDVTMYRLSEVGITKLKVPIERLRSVSFDGCTAPDNLPVSIIRAYALVTESRMNEIKTAFRGDTLANVVISIIYTVEVDGYDVGETTIERDGVMSLLPIMTQRAITP